MIYIEVMNNYIERPIYLKRGNELVNHGHDLLKGENEFLICGHDIGLYIFSVCHVQGYNIAEIKKKKVICYSI